MHHNVAHRCTSACPLHTRPPVLNHVSRTAPVQPAPPCDATRRHPASLCNEMCRGL